MLDVRIVLDDVPEYVFKACGATTQDERDTISACVRTYARDCIQATLLAIEDGPVFDAWRARADAVFDQFVTNELSDYEY